MSVPAKKILEEALELPPIERAELVEHIFESFEYTSQEKIDNLWIREAEDRINAYEAGRIKAIPAKDVFDKLNK